MILLLIDWSLFESTLPLLPYELKAAEASTWVDCDDDPHPILFKKRSSDKTAIALIENNTANMIWNKDSIENWLRSDKELVLVLIF